MPLPIDEETSVRAAVVLLSHGLVDEAMQVMHGLLPGENNKLCSLCGHIGEEDPVVGCPKCKWDEMQQIKAPDIVAKRVGPYRVTVADNAVTITRGTQIVFSVDGDNPDEPITLIRDAGGA